MKARRTAEAGRKQNVRAVTAVQQLHSSRWTVLKEADYVDNY
jgi:hypothetical protein